MSKALLADRLPLYSALSAGFNAAFVTASIQLTLPCDVYMPRLRMSGIARVSPGFITIDGEAHTWPYGVDLIATAQTEHGGPAEYPLYNKNSVKLAKGTEVQVVIANVFGLSAAGTAFGTIELLGMFDTGKTRANGNRCSDRDVAVISESVVLKG